MDIYVNSATKIINGITVLDSITMELHSGHVYGLRGSNGSGKTMILRLIAGLVRPNSGAVYVNGNRLGKDIDFPDSMGMILENPAFLPNYSGYRNLKLIAQIKNKVSDTEIIHAIQDVGLNPKDRRKYRKYSLGMKQRLAIAAAIMEKPDLILLDEPTNALDSEGIERICHLIKRESARGAIVIMACHDPVILESLADEVFLIEAGKLEKKGAMR